MADITLSNPQVLILKALARNPNGLTREQLQEKTGASCGNSDLGPQMVETLANHPECLYALRMVEPSKYTPDSLIIWAITPFGAKCADKYRARKTGPNHKVDTARLDKAVLSIRDLRTYGFELYTEDDLNEIRSKLPENDQDVTLPDLKQQIISRRKQGAYSRNSYTEPAWYEEYRDSHEFQVFATKVRALYDNCTVCNETEELTVYHRSFAQLGMERAKDGLLLCPACLKRNYKFVCEIPESSPFQEETSGADEEQEEGSEVATEGNPDF